MPSGSDSAMVSYGSIRMRLGSVGVSEVVSDGFRLTGGFHLSEDHEAMRTLSRVSNTTKISKLTTGRGVFRGPIFTRMFATDPKYGRPYVSSKDLVQVDVQPAGYLSLRHGVLLDELTLHERMVLVTCSGMNLGTA